MGKSTYVWGDLGKKKAPQSKDVMLVFFTLSHLGSPKQVVGVSYFPTLIYVYHEFVFLSNLSPKKNINFLKNIFAVSFRISNNETNIFQFLYQKGKNHACIRYYRKGH